MSEISSIDLEYKEFYLATEIVDMVRIIERKPSYKDVPLQLIFDLVEVETSTTLVAKLRKVDTSGVSLADLVKEWDCFSLMFNEGDDNAKVIAHNDSQLYIEDVVAVALEERLKTVVHER